MARVIKNDKGEGNWIESNEFVDAPGYKFIVPEFGDSYNVTVEKDATKVIISRKPAKEFGMSDNLQSGYDPELNVKLVENDLEEVEGYGEEEFC